MVQKVNFNNLTGDTLTVGNTVITGTGVTVSGSPLSGGSGGATQYANTSQLPKQDLTFGEFALIGNTLFITNGVGWYSVALINQSPSLSISVSDISLGTDGNTIDFTYTATDPDGPEQTVSVELIGANSAQANVTLYTANSTVTVENLSATDYSANIVLTATDGIDQTFGTVTLNVSYFSAVWPETLLSIGTSSTDGLGNITFIDRSTNAHPASTSGTPIQTAFHPYLDSWSNQFDSSSRLTWTGPGTIGTGDFTAEAWVKFSDLTADWRTIICQRAGAAAGGDQWVLGVHKTGYLYWYSTALHLTSSAGLITLDQWYHVAVSRSGTNMYLFIDGVLVHSVTNSHNLTYGNIIINANDNGTEAGNCFISNAR